MLYLDLEDLEQSKSNFIFLEQLYHLQQNFVWHDIVMIWTAAFKAAEDWSGIYFSLTASAQTVSGRLSVADCQEMYNTNH